MIFKEQNMFSFIIWKSCLVQTSKKELSCWRFHETYLHLYIFHVQALNNWQEAIMLTHVTTYSDAFQNPLMPEIQADMHPFKLSIILQNERNQWCNKQLVHFYKNSWKQKFKTYSRKYKMSNLTEIEVLHYCSIVNCDCPTEIVFVFFQSWFASI